jgi:hypothetical protein
MRNASKNPKVTYWRFESISGLFWCLASHNKCQASFKICTVQFTASGKKFFVICFFDSMLRTIFIIVWFFFLSVTSFCWGVYVAVNCLWMSFSSQKCVKFYDVNSSLRSVRRRFMNAPVSFSTLVLWDLKITIASNFSTKK